MPHVWLLAGYAGSGKTTAAYLLAKHLPKSRLLAFADRVKDEVAEQYGLPRPLLDTQEGKASLYKDTQTVRDLLIQLSAERKHTMNNPAIWAEYVKKELQNPDIEHWIVHDWRYKAEYDCMKSVPDIVLHTLRIQTHRAPPTHPSERELDDQPIETTVWNTGSLEELEATLFQATLTETSRR
jgi:hypothetical protein